jgi:SAM-dependent methyltransferase
MFTRLLVVALALWPSPAAYASDQECVRCPWCLRELAPGADECLDAGRDRVGRHWDINGQYDVAPRHVWQCPSVGGVYFADPVATPAELGKLYAHYHGAARGPRLAIRAKSQAMYLKRFLPQSAGRTVVEIGCASGALLAELASHRVVSDVVCFEQSGEAKAAERAVRAAGARSVKVVQSLWDANSDALSGGFDLFVSSHALEHVPDLCEFLAQVYRALRPGGYFFSEFPNSTDEYIKWQVKYPRPTKRGGAMDFHITHLTPRGLTAYMEATGFQLVDMETVNTGSQRTVANGSGLRFVWRKPSHPPTRAADVPSNKGYHPFFGEARRAS